MKNRARNQRNRDALIFDEAQRLLHTWLPEDLDAIAVSIGPGMFTSLRVGLSLAKGIALAHRTPIIGVNSLDVIGYEHRFFPGIVCVVVNAFHQEMYVALYNRGIRQGAYVLVRLDDITEMLNQARLLVGPGVYLLKEHGLLVSKNEQNHKESRFMFPTAEMVVMSACARFQNKDFDNIDMLEPFYIKKTDAERIHDQKNDH